jgi:SmpA / OmlA family
MVKLGPDGRLQDIANVLDVQNFARIRAGMTREQVLRILGPPPFRADYFAARDELAWNWRFCSDIGTAARFIVLFDGTSGIVRGTLSQDEGGEMRVSCSRWAPAR